MKIGIVTFQETNNYGAVWQNYALQQAIIKRGHEAETIDYKSEYIGRPYRFSHLTNKGLFSYLFGVMGYIIYLPRTKKCREFRKKLFYSRAVKKADLSKFNEEYDCFIIGSDQVWNHKLTGMDATYMLDFVTDKTKCNSFAASVGLSCIEEEKQKEYKRLLEGYANITVREKSARQLLEPIVGRDVETVSDPCVLLSYDEWSSVAKPMRPKNSYVVVYQLGVSADVVKLAKKIAKENNLKVVYVPFPVGSFGKGTWDVTAGNAELLGYIRDAAYVVTDSFHGTLLSIILNKQFFTKVSGTHAGVGSRIVDLLDGFGLSNRIISDNLNHCDKIDYSAVNPLLEQRRTEAGNCLEKILSK
ncbi:MAG: polysaccharide pyruvyl transferase family protein [Lachnospiraceae bacterium]|nr:polysaccharide pyruvyl transferase family protein [Lachnospiraceae bacterium]